MFPVGGAINDASQWAREVSQYITQRASMIESGQRFLKKFCSCFRPWG